GDRLAHRAAREPHSGAHDHEGHSDSQVTHRQCPPGRPRRSRRPGRSASATRAVPGHGARPGSRAGPGEAGSTRADARAGTERAVRRAAQALACSAFGAPFRGAAAARIPVALKNGLPPDTRSPRFSGVDTPRRSPSNWTGVPGIRPAAGSVAGPVIVTEMTSL